MQGFPPGAPRHMKHKYKQQAVVRVTRPWGLLHIYRRQEEVPLVITTSRTEGSSGSIVRSPAILVVDLHIVPVGTTL